MLTREKMFFAEHLSLMLKGGMTLNNALDILKKETKSKIFKRALGDISKRVFAGEGLTKSFKSHPKIFDKFFCSIIQVGEESGALEENLKYLAHQLNQDFETRKKIKGSLIYPGLVIVMALAIAFFVSFFILPKITELFGVLAIQLPSATKILITSTVFFRKYWLPAIAGAVLVVLLLRLILGLKPVRFYFDRITLFLPFLGEISRDINLARFARNLYTLLKSGMPIVEAMEICQETMPNEVYRRCLNSVKGHLEQGRKMSSGLKAFPQIFPSIFSQMIVAGENSGALEDTLLYLAEFHEKEMDSTLKNISGIIEPVLLIFVGIFVAFVTIAVITPIFKFTGQLRFR